MKTFLFIVLIIGISIFAHEYWAFLRETKNNLKK